MKIKDFADIYSGFNFRSALNSTSGGDMYVLQAKHISPYEYIDSVNNFPKIYSSDLRKPLTINQNDVAVVSRGSAPGTFKTAVFKFNSSTVIPSSSVLLIRVKSNSIKPEYLSLYLNSEIGQTTLFQSSIGSTFKSLTRRELGNIDINIPSLEQQKNLIDLQENLMQQNNITSRAQEIKKKLMNDILSQFSNL